MRSTPNVKVEKCRVRTGHYGTDESYGMNGLFIVVVKGLHLKVIASDGGGWDHCSVSMEKNPTRCPTWNEMCAVKELFFKDDETVVQFHPAKSAYINQHPYCLHLWRCQVRERELPPGWMVGARNEAELAEAVAAMERLEAEDRHEKQQITEAPE